MPERRLSAEVTRTVSCAATLAVTRQVAETRRGALRRLALALYNWLADRDRRADTNIPNASPRLSILSGHIKSESPHGYLPPVLLPGDIKYESANGNVRIYFPVVTSIALSVLFTLILRFIR
jgi:DUF2905 family protein